MFVSSANIIGSSIIDTSHRSLTYNRDSIGPKIDPSGTPYLIFNKKYCVLNICSQHSEINDSKIVNSSACFAFLISNAIGPLLKQPKRQLLYIYILRLVFITYFKIVANRNKDLINNRNQVYFLNNA